MSEIEADDLALLAESFGAAMREQPGPSEVDAALFGLGWGELLRTSERQGAAVAFSALGADGAVAGILDDVMLVGLGLEPSADTALILPGPGSSDPPGHTDTVSGLAGARLQSASTAIVARADGSVVAADAAAVRPQPGAGIDPAGAFQRVEARLGRTAPRAVSGSWAEALGAGRHALAHQLVAASRWMLAVAREHALSRVQFDRPVSSFQAIRHKLAEALVEIEAAASVAAAASDAADPLLDMLAKSLAGKAALTAARHAQQVLAGIGFTDEHPFQLRLKRVLVLDAVLGSAASLPADIGRALLAEGTAPKLIEL